MKNEIKVTELLNWMQREKMDEIAKSLDVDRKTITNGLNKLDYKYNRKTGNWEWAGEGNPPKDAVIEFGRAPKKRTEETAAPVESVKKQPTLEQTNQLPRRRAPLIVRKRKSFDIDIELLEQLEHFCYMNRVKQYEFVEKAIRTALQQQEEQ